jgi:hypothetical protein
MVSEGSIETWQTLHICTNSYVPQDGKLNSRIKTITNSNSLRTKQELRSKCSYRQNVEIFHGSLQLISIPSTLTLRCSQHRQSYVLRKRKSPSLAVLLSSRSTDECTAANVAGSGRNTSQPATTDTRDKGRDSKYKTNGIRKKKRGRKRECKKGKSRS